MSRLVRCPHCRDVFIEGFHCALDNSCAYYQPDLFVLFVENILSFVSLAAVLCSTLGLVATE